MADVVLDARMSNSELLKSIETVLNKAGERFNQFVSATDTKLNRSLDFEYDVVDINK